MPALPPGYAIGHQSDSRLNTGVTVVLPEQPVVAGYHIMGGSPGTRETDLLKPHQSVGKVDALCFAGGSAFGLDAAGGVQAWLRARGRGFPAGEYRVPIVPAAILFDLRTGKMDEWPEYPPHRELAHGACEQATANPAMGSVGAATGASTAAGPGGFGIASSTTSTGANVCAIVCCNAAGSPYIGDTDHFWAAPFEEADEFGGRGLPHPFPPTAKRARTKAGFLTNTTLAAVLTDCPLDAAGCERLSIVAHDGFARGLYPVHTPADGDIVFALASGTHPSTPDTTELGVLAANCVTRAIAVASFHAEAASQAEKEE